VGGVLGFALRHQPDQLRHLLVVVGARAPRTQLVVQSGQPPFLVSAAPVADRWSGDPRRRATSRLDWPSPDSSTICARRTNECGMLRERAIALNCSRSASLITTAVFGLPIRATSRCTLADLGRRELLMGHHTRVSSISARKGHDLLRRISLEI